MDAGSVERWLVPAYERTYAKIFETEWEKYNPYSGAFRYEAEGNRFSCCLQGLQNLAGLDRSEFAGTR
jgi:Protein of unknown function (DUF1479).